ncbi:HNH endonuclease [Anabaena cylindrica FACHB-243]|uniref:HNH endonuclease n=1 Tax=Anabaena cylindrica (strain ATCC 27899 / PCC 7122) TaxID=272123 RepID=K9ZJM5_ANACC|nr:MULTISPECIES: HNH endonuclease signature motif containing protein [Anabaena]AFZ58974.1 HNH endonuclease [Anabaena cylindrica PCC 7122]MBD2420682.1 HNH endonuclease [Anabaena cylindrica FACHB-243]MBY5284605.1 HNH endonuclease [Anabaena sp. CCAP 1446/1C]MBY5309315.1 HNH endonuclease [Anabaena sp. CCAP 1446/1C]MCM2409979.1 HNH endonuclease [Anabaena sp. CCAP 1446/1C]
MSSSQISEEVRVRVRTQANHQCGYCRSLQKYVLGILEIEHIIPKAKGGTDDEENLWLACRLCNSYKGTQTHGLDQITDRKIKLFNPRQQKWSRHFAWTNNGTHIMGLTACGRVTVLALQLNNIYAVTVRQAWVTAGWHPPKDNVKE